MGMMAVVVRATVRLARRESAVLVVTPGHGDTQDRLVRKGFRVHPEERRDRLGQSELRGRQERLVQRERKVSRARRDRLVILVLLVRQDHEGAEARRVTRVMMEPPALLVTPVPEAHEDDVDRKVTLATPVR